MNLTGGPLIINWSDPVRLFYYWSEEDTSTSPVTLKITVEFLGSLVMIVIVLFCFPRLVPALKVALMELDFPGAMTFSFGITAVQPQLEEIFRKTRLLLPAFVNWNTCVAEVFCAILPKLKVFVSNRIEGAFSSSTALKVEKSS